MSNYYKRNLPHYQPTGGEFFITFRLANSLRKSVIASLKHEHQPLSKQEDSDESTDERDQKKYFAKFDAFLDRSDCGKDWLNKDEIAQIVADKLHDFDDQWYKLICYCLMPNHVHLLFKLNERDKSRSTNTQFPITEILRLISTAYQANKELNRTGSFWQHESYDHLVRNDEERENIIRYILLNPVKAGLVNSWKDWKWTYCKKVYFPLR